MDDNKLTAEGGPRSTSKPRSWSPSAMNSWLGSCSPSITDIRTRGRRPSNSSNSCKREVPSISLYVASCLNRPPRLSPPPSSWSAVECHAHPLLAAEYTLRRRRAWPSSQCVRYCRGDRVPDGESGRADHREHRLLDVQFWGLELIIYYSCSYFATHSLCARSGLETTLMLREHTMQKLLHVQFTLESMPGRLVLPRTLLQDRRRAVLVIAIVPH